ncbi:MAG: prolyl oligopeptidase family serine peptidase [Pirellulaceae bacterium]|jgi:prolyl oligopeptidase
MRSLRWPWYLVAGLSILIPQANAQEGERPSSSKPLSESPSVTNDPWQWLEDVSGDKALDWVRARNALCQKKLESDPAFEPLRQSLLEILDSNQRIPMVSKRGDYYYNFWRDQKNPRGLWRRTTLDEYRKDQPAWEVLLDLDQLGEKEGESWVWKRASILRPSYRRALVTMSRGGSDADVTREFDLETRSFVEGGFDRPESKGGMDWIDEDHVFIYSDFGNGSMTTSGYPRIVKRWKRGTPLESAETVFEASLEDMSASGMHDDSPGFERSFLVRNVAFYNDELYYLPPTGSAVKIDVPNSVNKSVFREWLCLELREPWEAGGQSFAAGSLLVTRFDDFLSGKPKYQVLFEPTETSALASFSFTRDHLVLNVLEDVKNRLIVCTHREGNWSKEPLKGSPDFGTLSFMPVDPDESNAYFLTSTDYLTPTTLLYGQVGEAPEKLKSLPEFFPSQGLQIEQHFATSRDGTRVPYFQVSRKDLPLDGEQPTLLYGYGGFEISLQPSYNGSVGRAWASQGGVYVVANIRGGGEYGPRWHQAALRENRLKAYEDFAAVAEDLVSRKVTSPKRLGIQGGSNGGLLVGNMVTLYPELFQAAVCQVPLLDMQRYHKLLAGASWMAEYGNPDKPEDWTFIQRFSPYHNLREDRRYPSVLFTTSTKDDRVHPGHARKMMAKMESMGYPVLYYENIEGGHGGAANNQQSAYMQALAYTFLRQQLMSTK